MEEYITAEELATRIKEKRQTIYNRIYKQQWCLGIHYLKPTPRKLLFKWSAIVCWLEGNTFQPNRPIATSETFESQPLRKCLKSEITI